MAIYMWREYHPELCFTANTAGSSVTLNKIQNPTNVTLETSTNGISWSTYTFGTTMTLTNVGDKLYWRNTSTTTTGFSLASTGYNIYQFVMTGSINASGDVTSLINKNLSDTVSSMCFSRLFWNCSSLKTAPKLPATSLGTYCYYYMFSGSGIAEAPELPATTLANNCYGSMFDSCTSLTTVSALPATALANNCYNKMYKGCTSLNTLPKLSATTFKSMCYSGMFNGCSNIKMATSSSTYYQYQYRLPASGTGSTASSWNYEMFASTGGTFTGDPTINTTYYTSNTVV